MRLIYNILSISVFLGIINMPAKAQSTYNCGEPPPGIHSVAGGTDYTDEHHSVVDPKLKGESEGLAKPFNDYMETVSRAADTYLANNDKSAARCAITWLNKWADDNALTGELQNKRGLGAVYVNLNLLNSLSFAFLKVLPEATPDEKAKISAWLKRGVNRVAVDYIRKNPDGNNHVYWAALGVMVMGVITDDQDMIKMSAKIYNTALRNILPDGTLAKENARGQMALSYNGWACAPLFLMSEVARKMGKNWYGREDGKLSLLADRFVEGLNNSDWFEKKIGIKQIVPSGRNLAWLELYKRVSKNPEKVDAVLTGSSYYRSVMGGDLKMMAKMNYYSSNGSK